MSINRCVRSVIETKYPFPCARSTALSSSLRMIMRRQDVVSQGSVSTRLNLARSFGVSVPCHLKEIQVRTTDNLTVVEGIVVESDRAGKLLQVEAEKARYCPLCPNRLKTSVKYTDVLILSQFLQPDGEILPREVTGLCYSAQVRLLKLAYRSHRAGLMPELQIDSKTGLPKVREKWAKYNTYWEE